MESSSTSDPSTAAQNLASASASAASNDTDLIKLGMLDKLAGSAPAGHSDLPAGLLLGMRGHQCGSVGNQSAQLGDAYKTRRLVDRVPWSGLGGRRSGSGRSARLRDTLSRSNDLAERCCLTGCWREDLPHTPMCAFSASVPRKRKPQQGKLPQAPGETETWRALSRQGKMAW